MHTRACSSSSPCSAHFSPAPRPRAWTKCRRRPNSRERVCDRLLACDSSQVNSRAESYDSAPQDFYVQPDEAPPASPSPSHIPVLPTHPQLGNKQHRSLRSTPALSLIKPGLPPAPQQLAPHLRPPPATNPALNQKQPGTTQLASCGWRTCQDRYSVEVRHSAGRSASQPSSQAKSLATRLKFFAHEGAVRISAPRTAPQPNPIPSSHSPHSPAEPQPRSRTQLTAPSQTQPAGRRPFPTSLAIPQPVPASVTSPPSSHPAPGPSASAAAKEPYPLI